MKLKKPKIFIGFIEIAGRYSSLQYGFRQLGYDTLFVSYKRNRFYHLSPSGFKLLDRYFLYVQKGFSVNTGIGAKLINKSITYFGFPFFFTWALIKYDYFIFASGQSFFSIFQFIERFKWYRLLLFDYKILRLFNKKILVQFHGSDSRPPYLNGAALHSINFSIPKLYQLTRRKSIEIDFIDRHAHHIIDIPPQGYFHKRPFILRLLSGLPSGPFFVHRATEKNKKITIVHAPSKPEIKGTDIIENHINTLSKDYPIEYIQIINKNNSEVIEAIGKADIVVDQLYCDYGLAGLATEASWLKKPVIIGGNAVALWNKILPNNMIPATIYCSSEEVFEHLELLVKSEEERIKAGERAFNYVSSYHSPLKVAENFISIFHNNYSKDWEYLPLDSNELYGGYFAKSDEIKNAIQKLINEFGIGALQLEDKPALCEKVVLFANQK